METKNISFTASEARAMYPTAPRELREKLEATFGIETLTYQEPAIVKTDIRDIVKTYEDACRVNGHVPMGENTLRELGFTEAELANRKLAEIALALNEGVIMDWENIDQEKWYPWFSVSPAGFSFDDAGYYCSYPDAGVASRLCFVSSELAEYAGTQFVDLYRISIL